MTDQGIHIFKPTIRSLLPKEFYKKFNFLDKIKLSFRFLWGGYLLYYLAIDGKIIGYCFLKHNWFGKYKFLNKNDWLINPYYVYEEYRGNGYAQQIIEYMLKSQSGKNGKIFAVVKDDNIISKFILSKLGFIRVGYATEGFYHSLTNIKTSLIVMTI